MTREVIIEWDTSVDPSYAINVSKYIGASTIMLIVGITRLSNLSKISESIEEYRVCGFSVCISVSANRLILPSDIAGLLNLNIVGSAVDIFGTSDPLEAESSLIDLSKVCRAANKHFAYYHGDGLSDVNATRLASEGIFVWAWWTGAWKPGTWNLPAIWAQQCIWNRNGSYTTPTDIQNWYTTLPKKPQGIVWWLTTCMHSPTEEQIQAMRQISHIFTQ